MNTSTPDPATREGNRAALVQATVAFTICFYAWSLLGPLGPEIQDQLGLSNTELALTIAIPVVLGSLMRIPLGVLTDRHGGRVTFSVVMGFVPIPLVGLALLNDSWAAVLACGFLLGFAGATFAIGVPFVNAWYPPSRQGFALGIYGIGTGGTVLAALTAPRIVDAAGIDVVFWTTAAVLAVSALGFWLTARDAPGAIQGHQGSMLSMLSSFRGPGSARAWGLAFFYFVAFGGFVAMFLFLPKLLHSVHDLSKTDAGARAAGFALLAVVARPIGGWLSDRIGAQRVLTVSFVGTIVCALILAAGYEEMVALTVGCLTMATFLGLGTGATFKLVPSWFPDRVGAVTGVVGASGGLGGFFPPLVMAFVQSATGGYALGFVLLGVTAGLALLALVALERPATRARAAPVADA